MIHESNGVIVRLLLVLLVFSLPAPVLAKPWQQAIDDVATLADKYADAVRLQTGNSVTYYYGTMHHPTDWQMHMCAILGRQLGFAKYIAHLEPQQPSLASPPEILAVNYVSLTNWITAAQMFVGMSRHKRATYWNNECVGNMGTPRKLWVSVPREAFFAVQDNTLFVYGDIIPGFADRLRLALLKHPEVTEIGLGSGGGNVVEALKAGQLIRRGGYSVVLSGTCQSACPLVFLGGVERRVYRGSLGSQRFGLHKIAANGVAVPNDDPVYDLVYEYVKQLGGNADMILTAMQNFEPFEMGFFKLKVECPMRLATWYQGYFPGECPH